MISLSASQNKLATKITLPASKSESNRALIIRGLCKEPAELHNLSSARDTQTMIRLLESEGHVLDVIDAGTTMRFLTAYFCAVGRDQILTGTPRMCKRPIGILVEALKKLGGQIDYWSQEGFPPLHIVSKGPLLNGGELQMDGGVSSQFITAVIMIAPTLPNGLRLELTGEIRSKPYIELTRSLMKHFGVETSWDGQTLVVPEKAYTAAEYTIESDWSSASYWYSLVALAEDKETEVELLGLRKNSWQGDQRIAELMRHFGVKSRFTDEGVVLTKVRPRSAKKIFEIDFTDTPDLAQTIAVVSAAKGMPVKMTGLETLRIKETDRIEALRNELAKFGVQMEVNGNDCLIQGKASPTKSTIDTYEDHRMAMAFAPMVLQQPTLMINDPEVVEKSYPEFWKHLELAGIRSNIW